MKRTGYGISQVMRFVALYSVGVVCFGLVTAASADQTVIYQTDDPFGSPFGVIGFDVGQSQSVAVRFTPSETMALDEIRPWFMNNAAPGVFPVVELAVVEDLEINGESFPGENELEVWEFSISAIGWNPEEESVISVKQPVLEAGQHYWVRARSSAAPGQNAVWNWAGSGVGTMSICCCPASTCEWSAANRGAVSAMTVLGTPVDDDGRPGDLNGDGVVNVLDLLILLGAWGPCDEGRDCPADLNEDGTVNVLDLLILLENWG